MLYEKEALAYHREPRPGKIEVVPLKPCRTQSDLSLAYSPGVAAPCLEIKKMRVWSSRRRQIPEHWQV